MNKVECFENNKYGSKPQCGEDFYLMGLVSMSAVALDALLYHTDGIQ